MNNLTYFGIAYIVLFLSPLLSAQPSRYSRKIDFAVLLFFLLLPDKIRGINIAFLSALIAKHGSLALNHVTTGTTT